MQPSGNSSHRFGSDRRIRRRAEFQRVFDTGQRVHGRFMTVLVAPNQAGTARLGIVASKKLGDAVHRNRAKRLIRELFRRSAPAEDGAGLDVVVIPRRELFEATYPTLENDFRTVLRRCAGRLTRRETH
jgi:ribonuclease P protein component